MESLLRVGLQRRWLVASVGLVALLHAAWVLHGGARMSSDSATYSRWADTLIAVHFNPTAFLERSTFVYSPIVYLNWIALLAVAKLALGSHWMTGIVALNWVTIVVTAAAIFMAVRVITRCGPSVVIAALLFLSAFDILLFVPFVLSDVVFLGLSTAVLLTGLWLVRASEEDPGHRRRWRLLTVGTVLLIIAGLTRPTVLPLLGYWLLAIGLSGRLGARASWLLAGAIGLALTVTLGIVVHAAFMMEPGNWPFHAGAGWIRQLSAEYHAGMVVFGRPATSVPPPSHWYVDFVALTLLKWLYYFAPVMSDYSGLHTVMNALFFGTAYMFSLVALAKSRNRRSVTLLTAYTIAFSLFHAMQQIDYDFRYRLPVLPALMIGAALGLSVLLPGPTGFPRETPRPRKPIPKRI